MVKRARRIFTGLSLLMLLGVAGMWGRGQFVAADGHGWWMTGAGETVRRRDLEWVGGARSLVVRLETTTVAARGPAEAAGVRRDLAARAGRPTEALEPRAAWAREDGWRGSGAFWAAYDFRLDREYYPLAVRVNGVAVATESRVTVVGVWWWLLAVSCALAPAAALWRWARARRVRPGTCRGCGYDLRATPAGGGALLARCPECGRASGGGADAGVGRT